MGKHLNVTDETLDNWGEWLDEFKWDVYPVFQKRGLSFAEAVVIWKFNELSNEVYRTNKLLANDDPDANAPWRPKD